MAVINRIAEYFEDMKEWRQHLHAHPELDMDCHRTAAFVAEKLRAFGVDEIHEKIGVSGVVGIINGQGDGPTIGLRADMDALPMPEETGLPYASTVEGMMHACGHDGHTTMLLGAARYLAETRKFSGRVALIFQPGEEGSGGARFMVEDGLIDRFNISQVYGQHSLPKSPLGNIETCPGPLMAAADDFEIHITGAGGHAASPHESVDPVMIAVNMYQNLQSIVTRNVDPIKTVVLSLTQIHSGTTHNVVPETAMLAGTVRTFDKDVQALVVERMQAIIHSTAEMMGGKARLDYNYGYPATINDAEKTNFACDVAAEVVGETRVARNIPPTMGAEDFSYMLEEVPGAYFYIGNGDSAYLHHTKYDFNDEASPTGASVLARIVERAQPLAAG